MNKVHKFNEHRIPYAKIFVSCNYLLSKATFFLDSTFQFQIKCYEITRVVNIKNKKIEIHNLRKKNYDQQKPQT